MKRSASLNYFDATSKLHAKLYWTLDASLAQRLSLLRTPRYHGVPVPMGTPLLFFPSSSSFPSILSPAVFQLGRRDIGASRYGLIIRKLAVRGLCFKLRCCCGLFVKNLVGPPQKKTVQYTQSAVKNVRGISAGQTEFFGGEYYVDGEDDKHNCSVKADFSIEEYELLKKTSHEHVLGLISYHTTRGCALAEKLAAETFCSYAQTRRAELVDANGELTPKFENFIRKILGTLKFLQGKRIAHGHLSCNSILVWDGADEEIKFKLYKMAVRGPSQSSPPRSRSGLPLVPPRVSVAEFAAHIADDLNKLSEIILDAIGGENVAGARVSRFCSYLRRAKIKISDALGHPFLTMQTNFEKRIYLENLIERPQYREKVNKSNIRWLNDRETKMRRIQSEKKMNTEYARDTWDFVHLIRNSMKHYDEWAKAITSQLPTETYAYLNHVEGCYPNFIFDIYELCGSVS